METEAEAEEPLKMGDCVLPLGACVCVHGRTCPVHDVDWSAGCGAVSSTRHSVDGDRVVSAGLQVGDGGSGLSARHCELLGVTMTAWRRNDIVMNVRETNI